jgi:hypothetical protein
MANTIKRRRAFADFGRKAISFLLDGAPHFCLRYRRMTAQCAA